MPRSIVFGNRQLLVCLDKEYNIRDIYYPHVGMENHLNGHHCRIGIWVDGLFSWLESDEWIKDIKYEEDTLVGHSYFENKRLSVKLEIVDCVHKNQTIFLRKLEITNLSDNERQFRVFFTQDLQIYGINIGITAYYDPEVNSVIHYLKDRWFLFNGRGDNNSIDSFATGKIHFGTSEGTYKDAENGLLSENPIDQGTVDSTIQFNVTIRPNKKGAVEYWFAVAKNYKKVKELNYFVKNLSVSKSIEETIASDRAWTNKCDVDFYNLPEEVINLFRVSALVVRSQFDHEGAIIAANDSDIMQFNRDHYSYMWPRDGALVAFSLDKAGYPFVSKSFYEFCSRVLSPQGFLAHKYNPDGSMGSSWHPRFDKEEGSVLAIQEDETALVLFALWKHYILSKNLILIDQLYEKFIIPAADFMLDFRDERGLPLPSYDLWEERKGIHTFTVSAVYAGLIAAADFANLFYDHEREEKYRKTAEKIKELMIKYLYDDKLKRFLRTINFNKDGSITKDSIIDASLYAIFEFNVFSANDPLVVTTMEQVRDRLWIKTDVGGIARYENDYYHKISDDIERVPGNPWYICTLWLAEWYIHSADRSEEGEKKLNKALDILTWVVKHTLSSNILAEQVNPFTNDPISVSPLTWSHATYILTVIEYIEKYEQLTRCETCGQFLRPLDYEKSKPHKD